MTKHGRANTPQYKSWHAMVARCHNPNHHAYSYYGGRGIRVCERWRSSFMAFVEDMGDRPEGMTVERVDGDGDYTPENCVWATRKAQQRNLRSNHRITINGVTRCISEWAEESGLDHAAIRSRLNRGWTPYDAVTKPRMNQGRKDLQPPNNTKQTPCLT